MTETRIANDPGQLKALLETVERLRRDSFPDLDRGLVADILSLHADAAATEVDLARGVEQLVDRYLASGV